MHFAVAVDTGEQPYAVAVEVALVSVAVVAIAVAVVAAAVVVVVDVAVVEHTFDNLPDTSSDLAQVPNDRTHQLVSRKSNHLVVF
jgi:hypothetical protein